MKRLALISAVTLVFGCSDLRSNSRSVDAGDGDAGIVRAAVSVAATADDGTVHVGGAADGADLLLIDGRTQRPVSRARIDVVPQASGYLVRASLDEEAYEPEVIFVERGRRTVVPMEPATAAMRSRVVRPQLQVFDDEWIADTNLAGVASVSVAQGRPNVIFLPAVPSDQEANSAQFHVYRSPLPKTLIAVLASTAGRPSHGALVSGAARSVSTTGARRAGAIVSAPQLGVAARGRSIDVAPAPRVAALTATPGSEPGTVVLNWTANDQAQRLLGFEVGVDTVKPEKRLGPESLSHLVVVRQGAHFACVRPVFDGADAETQLECVPFVVDNVPAAPNVRVRVRRLAETPGVARRPMPVEITVENAGMAPAPAFDLAVVVSPDGKASSGLGEVRTIHIDGVPAGGSTLRTATVAPPRDGAFFVVAHADPLGELKESNIQDNSGRAPITVMPAGTNRAPVLSLSVPLENNAVAAGQPVVLSAFASDPEDGDISGKIVWTSSIDGPIGQGSQVSTSMLSPGVHHVRASVADGTLPATVLQAKRNKGRQPVALRGQAAPNKATSDDSITVVAQLNIEIFVPATSLNSPPVAEAGPDLVATAGKAVFPLGVARDADGDGLTIGWQVFDGAGTPVALPNASQLRFAYTPAAPGVYVLVLSVSDGKVTARGQCVLTVFPSNSNRTPEVLVQAPEAGFVGTPVVANITAMDADGDGVNLSYFLSRPNGSLTLLANANGNMPAYTPDVVGSYTLTAWADDGRGVRVQASASTVVGPALKGAQNGAACTAGTDCDSGFCADGVCCNSTCGGACESCALTATRGQCMPVAAGAADPKGLCAVQAAATCGTNGSCDGKGGCARWPAATMCRASNCVNGLWTQIATCDGATSVCPMNAAVGCAPFTCNATATACRTDCVLDADCVAPAKCTNGTCGLGANGAMCSAGAQCQSGNCIDGVCCNSTCAGACVACNVPGSLGTCAPVPAGGADAMCNMQAANTCGNDGTCNGSGACRMWSATTTCAMATCNANSVVGLSNCNGLGMCMAPAAVSCGAYACNPTTIQCRTTCTKDSDCATGNYCSAGVCNDGLVFRFTFDNGAGTTAADGSGNGNTGTVKAGTSSTNLTTVAGSWTPGRTGLGLSLDGIDRTLAVPRSASIDNTGSTGSFTMSAWTFPRALNGSGDSWVMSRHEVGTSYEHFGLGFNSAKPTASVHFFFASASGTAPLNQWSHLTATYDGITLIVYVNGVAQSSLDVGWPIAADTTNVLIGANQNVETLSGFFNGVVDDVRLYARTMSAAEVAALAQ